MLTSLHKFLLAPSNRWSDPRLVFWYGLSLLFATYYGYLWLQSAFAGAYVMQDDARQHVFWMLRFVDAGAFPNDLMADYYQANAPVGYTWLYRIAAAWGIHPYSFSKILPPLLGLLGTHYCFRLSLQIMPLPAAAFTSSLMLNQSLWMRDDLMSGTPRAFFYVLLLAFLVHVNRRWRSHSFGVSLLPCLIVLVLQPLFYPVSGLMSAAILAVRLVRFEQGRLQLTRDPKDYLISGLGLAILVGLLAPYALASNPFGPLITSTEARTMPEFWSGGRASYFTHNPIQFWFGDRTGLVPTPIFTPPTMVFSLLFPWLWWRSQSAWMPPIRARAAILQQLVAASLLLYFAAHLVLFQLYLPSRYTHHSFRIVFALTASFAIWLLLDELLRMVERSGQGRRQRLQKGLAAVGTSIIAIALLGYPASLNHFPGLFNNARHGVKPELYEFLSHTPSDTVIASLTKETSNLHVFTQRSPLISPELGLPYHTGYYQQFRARVGDLINAQYSDDLSQIQAFIEKYGVDFWLLDDQVFAPDWLRQNGWFNQHLPEAPRAIARVEHAPNSLVLEQAKATCTVLETTPEAIAAVKLADNAAQRFWLLDAHCLSDLSL
ncbi:MAG: hypothetical protein AAF722_13695 [Cyanobacteria bacterium P01_C01_bin.70]